MPRLFSKTAPQCSAAQERETEDIRRENALRNGNFENTLSNATLALKNDTKILADGISPETHKQNLITHGFTDAPLSEQGKYYRDIANAILRPRIEAAIENKVKGIGPGIPYMLDFYLDKKEELPSMAAWGFLSAFSTQLRKEYKECVTLATDTAIDIAHDPMFQSFPDSNLNNTHPITAREGPQSSSLHIDLKKHAFTATLPFLSAEATTVISNTHKEFFTTPFESDQEDICNPKKTGTLRLTPEGIRQKDNIQPDYGNPDSLRILACGDSEAVHPDIKGNIHSIPFPPKQEKHILKHGSSRRESWLKRFKPPIHKPRVAFLDRLMTQEQKTKCETEARQASR